MDENIGTNKIFISIIIPIFNVERYLIRCLDSIFNQSISFPFEVIAVNDGSTDNSLAILENYRLKFPQVRIINHEENQKLSKARLSGINIARGNYIMHLDSDDWILPNTLDRIFTIVNKEPEYDVFIFNYAIQNKHGKLSYMNYIKQEEDIFQKVNIQNLFLGACWNKIVKKSILSDIVYGKKAINSEEDLIYSVEILIKGNNIKLLPNLYYVYSRNHSSITNTDYLLNYIENKINVLESLSIIFKKYTNHRLNTLLVYNYVSKWIYLFIFRNHLENKVSSKNIVYFFEELKNRCLLPETFFKKLYFSKNSIFYCFFVIIHEFGIITPFFYIRDSILKNIKKN